MRHGLPTHLMLSVVALALILCQAHGFSDDTASAQEYQLKAAYLIKFIRFVEWPDSALPTGEVPFRIGVLGDDPFGPALEDVVRDESFHNHHLAVLRSAHLDDLTHCQVLFIARSEQDHVADLIAALGSRPVLVVSDIERFADHGGMIGLFLERKKLRFEINTRSAQHQNLKMSAQFLSLGKLVDRDADVGHH